MHENILSEAFRIFDEEIDALIKAKARLDESFIEAVKLICSAEKVIVSGIGKSGLIGTKISATLSSVGVPSVFLHPVEALHGDIGIVGSNDVVILLSKSGSTDEIVNLIPYIKMRSAKIISIVGNAKSFMAHNSDIVLDAAVDREACLFNLAPTSSSTLALVIGDALAMCAMKMKKVTLEDFSRLHPLGQIGRNITLKVSDVMHRNGALPVISEKESFRNAVIEITNKGMGCVCVISQDEKLEGIITDGDVRRILQNSEDLRGLTVGNVMTRNPVTIGENSYLGEALALMENRSSEIGVLPVIEGNKLIGLIRLHDIVRTGV